MVSQETLLKIAKLMGIHTLGKGEEEIKRSILEILRPTTEASSGGFKIEDLAKSFGRMMGEFEHMKNEVQQSITKVQEEVRTPLIQTSNELQRDITQMQREVKAPLVQMSASVERTLAIARTLGLDIRGKMIVDVQKEIKKVLGI